MNTPTRIANWTNDILRELSKLEDGKGIEILRNCGASCSKASELHQGALAIRDQYPQESNVEVLFNAFKEAYYNSPNFSLNDETITLIFEECTCPLVQEGVNNPFLCNCTMGYSQQIFTTLFNSPVKVELEESILQGRKVCRQRIEVTEE